MGFGGVLLISGPGGGYVGFPPPPSTPPPAPQPPLVDVSTLSTCTSGFCAGPGGAFPAGCT